MNRQAPHVTKSEEWCDSSVPRHVTNPRCGTTAVPLSSLTVLMDYMSNSRYAPLITLHARQINTNNNKMGQEINRIRIP